MSLAPPEVVPYDYEPEPVQELAHSVHVDELLYGGAAGGGKLLAYSTPVLTTRGWTTHGQLVPGDQVYGHDGQPVTVLASYTPTTACHYLITFSTGETIRAGREHLWTVQTATDRQAHTRSSPEYQARRRAARTSRAVTDPARGQVQSDAAKLSNTRRAEAARVTQQPDVWDYTRTLETHELAELVNTQDRAVSIPGTGPTQGDTPWPGATPPWVLGMWLGDGSTRDGEITHGQQDTPTLMGIMAEHGYTRRGGRGLSHTFTGPDGRALGHHISEDLGQGKDRVKHIPGWAYTTRLEDRLALLQGIVDADGHINARGQVELSLSDERLARDVSRLLATLGVRASPRPGSAALNGKPAKTRWRVNFTATLQAARYPRKAQRLTAQGAGPATHRSVYITSVTQVPADEPANCIQVSDPRGLYLAGDTLVPTHNTRFALAEAVICALGAPGSRVLILRRNYPDLEDIEDKLTEQMPAGVAKWKPSRHRWEFHNGSIIRLGHLAHREDVKKYIGQEYTLIIFEEATEFTPYQYLMLRSRLRASGELRDRLAELGWRPRSIATTNPGGRSHGFFKARFIDSARPYEIHRPTPTEEEPHPGTRCFIPALSTDNSHLDDNYHNVLSSLPEAQRRAYRDGDWDVLEGVRFPGFRRNTHVIRPEALPITALTGRKAIGVDYGLSSPFAAVWLCKLADGLIVVYRELYAAGLTATQQAEAILELSAAEEKATGDKIPVIADPSMWHRQDAGAEKPLDPTAPPVGSPAHFYQRVLGRKPHKAVNARQNGWALIDEKLRVREDRTTRLLIYDTCLDLIRTLPEAPRDKRQPEDVDTDSEDHNLDALRYAAMWLEGKSATRAFQPGSGRRRDMRQTTAGIRDVNF